MAAVVPSSAFFRLSPKFFKSTHFRPVMLVAPLSVFSRLSKPNKSVRANREISTNGIDNICCRMSDPITGTLCNKQEECKRKLKWSCLMDMLKRQGNNTHSSVLSLDGIVEHGAFFSSLLIVVQSHYCSSLICK